MNIKHLLKKIEEKQCVKEVYVKKDIITVILLKGFSRFRIDEEDKINEILNLC